MGVAEVSIACLVGFLSLGLPVVILVLLVMIYNKLKVLEELLKSKGDE